MENKRQKVEISDIFRRFESDYHQQYYMAYDQQKAFDAILNCRSQNMGGHTLRCDRETRLTHYWLLQHTI